MGGASARDSMFSAVGGVRDAGGGMGGRGHCLGEVKEKVRKCKSYYERKENTSTAGMV